MRTTTPETAALEYALLQTEYWEEEKQGVPMSVHERYRRAFDRLRSAVRSVHHRRQLGQLLIEMGLITERELEEALQAQRAAGGERLLGEVLVAQGVVEPEDVRRAVERQLNVNSYSGV